MVSLVRIRVKQRVFLDYKKQFEYLLTFNATFNGGSFYIQYCPISASSIIYKKSNLIRKTSK
jgi:hypothetical protein